LPVGGFQALILMEYCPGGGVIDLMNRRLQQRLTEPEILGIFSDVAEVTSKKKNDVICATTHIKSRHWLICTIVIRLCYIEI
jgi:serine/threonine protein kinase